MAIQHIILGCDRAIDLTIKTRFLQKSSFTIDAFQSVLTKILHLLQLEAEPLVSRSQVEPGNEGLEAPPPDY